MPKGRRQAFDSGVCALTFSSFPPLPMPRSGCKSYPCFFHVTSTQGLPWCFCAGAMTFQGYCDVKNFTFLPSQNGCQRQCVQTMFHGFGMYFGSYPGSWKESCPWVTLGIFKYAGPEIQCPGAHTPCPVQEPLSCSWLYKLAGCQDHLWHVQCWGGGGVDGETHLFSR